MINKRMFKRQISLHLTAIVAINLVLAANAVEQEKLIFAADVIRHGERAPRYALPESSYEWPEGLRQLTAKGIRQEFELGTKLRGLYIDKFKLLPSRYRPGTIRVRSTDIDRTLMSAQSFLMGLYPPGTGPIISDAGLSALPGGVQIIPVHTVDQSYDPLIPDCRSNNFPQLLEKYVVKNQEWIKLRTDLAPKFPEWSKAAGFQVNDLATLRDFADTVEIYRNNHVLPASISDDAEIIIEAGHRAAVEEYRPKEMGLHTGLYLLKTIQAGFHGVIDHRGSTNESTTVAHAEEPPPMYELFSAHDSTLLSTMSAMGSPMTNVPPYASDLRFELFQNADGGFRVEITFNDQPVNIPVFGNGSGALEKYEKLCQ